MFSLHFIKTGEIPETHKDGFALLFERRQMADYDMDGDFPIDEIQRLVKVAENFLTYVKTTYA